MNETNSGEDAFFVNTHGLGVADRVGSMVGKTQSRRVLQLNDSRKGFELVIGPLCFSIYKSVYICSTIMGV